MKKIRLIIKGYRIVYTLNKSYIPLQIIASFITTFIPVFVLYMSAMLINELSYSRNLQRALFLAIVLVGVSFLLNLFRTIINVKTEIFQKTMYSEYLSLLGKHYMQLDFKHTEDKRTNELISTIEAKTISNGAGIINLCWYISTFFDGFFGVVLALYLLNGVFGTQISSQGFIASRWVIFALSKLIILALFISNVLQRNIAKILKKVFSQNPKVNITLAYYREYITSQKAAKDIRLYGQQGTIKKIIKSRENMKLWGSYFHTSAAVEGGNAFIYAVISGVAYIVLGIRFMLGMYLIGDMIKFAGAITSLTLNLTVLISIIGQYKNNVEQLLEVFEFLGLGLSENNGRNNQIVQEDEFSIEFKNVWFKYSGSEKYALEDISFKIEKNRSLAIVGQNGSGKTTLIKLLCRLYRPEKGEILLNGVDIFRYDNFEYLKAISVVFQDFSLFGFSLAENISASKTFDEDKIKESITHIGLGDLLDNLPLSLNTPIGTDFDPNGINFSGGEMQKIAIARTLYKDSGIIILDEPSAALDPIAEYELYMQFNKISKNKTAIFISHRLSSCQFCDNILVLKNGELIQQGTHKELLMQNDSEYHKFWSIQASQYIS